MLGEEPKVRKLDRSTQWGKITAPLYFCNNFVKTFDSEMIIGTYIL